MLRQTHSYRRSRKSLEWSVLRNAAESVGVVIPRDALYRSDDAGAASSLGSLVPDNQYSAPARACPADYPSHVKSRMNQDRFSPPKHIVEEVEKEMNEAREAKKAQTRDTSKKKGHKNTDTDKKKENDKKGKDRKRDRDGSKGKRSGSSKKAKRELTKEEKEKRARERAQQKWTDSEKADFMRLFRANGRDWVILSSTITTKTTAQIKNFYQNYKTKLGLQDILNERERRLAAEKKE